MTTLTVPQILKVAAVAHQDDGTDKADPTAEWATSDPAILGIRPTDSPSVGYFDALAEGTVTITATVDGVTSAAFEVTVSEVPDPSNPSVVSVEIVVLAILNP